MQLDASPGRTLRCIRPCFPSSHSSNQRRSPTRVHVKWPYRRSDDGRCLLKQPAAHAADATSQRRRRVKDAASLMKSAVAEAGWCLELATPFVELMSTLYIQRAQQSKDFFIIIGIPNDVGDSDWRIHPGLNSIFYCNVSRRINAVQVQLLLTNETAFSSVVLHAACNAFFNFPMTIVPAGEREKERERERVENAMLREIWTAFSACSRR